VISERTEAKGTRGGRRLFPNDNKKIRISPKDETSHQDIYQEVFHSTSSLINDENGECVKVFLLVEVHNYYKLRDPKERLNTDFVVNFYECHDTSQVMASWWREDKKYTNQTSSRYRTTNLREPYIYLMSLICRLYGEKDYSRFSEAWMPLDYTIAISRRGFNWGSIISKQLSIFIQQA
jgi:hypothetical protein